MSFKQFFAKWSPKWAAPLAPGTLLELATGRPSAWKTRLPTSSKSRALADRLFSSPSRDMWKPRSGPFSTILCFLINFEYYGFIVYNGLKHRYNWFSFSYFCFISLISLVFGLVNIQTAVVSNGFERRWLRSEDVHPRQIQEDGPCTEGGCSAVTVFVDPLAQGPDSLAQPPSCEATSSKAQVRSTHFENMCSLAKGQVVPKWTVLHWTWQQVEIPEQSSSYLLDSDWGDSNGLGILTGAKSTPLTSARSWIPNGWFVSRTSCWDGWGMFVIFLNAIWMLSWGLFFATMTSDAFQQLKSHSIGRPGLSYSVFVAAHFDPQLWVFHWNRWPLWVKVLVQSQTLITVISDKKQESAKTKMLIMIII